MLYSLFKIIITYDLITKHFYCHVGEKIKFKDKKI